MALAGHDGAGRLGAQLERAGVAEGMGARATDVAAAVAAAAGLLRVEEEWAWGSGSPPGSRTASATAAPDSPSLNGRTGVVSVAGACGLEWEGTGEW